MIGLAIFVCAFGAFALYAHPRDPLAALGAHLSYEDVSYEQERDPATDQIVFFCHRAAGIRDMSLTEAGSLMHVDRMTGVDDFYMFEPGPGPGVDAPSLVANGNTGTILIVSRLSDVQVLWVRLMHPGSNPFGKAIATP